MQVFGSLGLMRTKLGPKKPENKKVQKNPVSFFRVLDLLTKLQFSSRHYHWFQLMHRTNGCVYAQVVGARCKKEDN